MQPIIQGTITLKKALAKCDKLPKRFALRNVAGELYFMRTYAPKSHLWFKVEGGELAVLQEIAKKRAEEIVIGKPEEQDEQSTNHTNGSTTDKTIDGTNNGTTGTEPTA